MEAAPFAVTSPFCDVPASAPGPKIPEEGSEVTSFVHQHWCQHMFKVTLILEPWVRKTPQINEQTTEINLLSQDGPSPIPTILDCPQVLKSHPIHGEDPIPNTGRCISKKNPKPTGCTITLNFFDAPQKSIQPQAVGLSNPTVQMSPLSVDLLGIFLPSSKDDITKTSWVDTGLS